MIFEYNIAVMHVWGTNKWHRLPYTKWPFESSRITSPHRKHEINNIKKRVEVELGRDTCSVKGGTLHHAKYLLDRFSLAGQSSCVMNKKRVLSRARAMKQLVYIQIKENPCFTLYTILYIWIDLSGIQCHSNPRIPQGKWFFPLLCFFTRSYRNLWPL